MLSPRLRTLRLDLSIEATATCPIELDFSYLKPETLHLERFVVICRLTLWSEFVELCKNAQASFLCTLEKEISRLGRLWLCEGEVAKLGKKVKTRLVANRTKRRGGSEIKYQSYMIKFEVARL